jgi:phosphatidylglycerophosphatase A
MKINLAPDSVWRNPIHFIAFGFGSGAMPFAPGTFGTLMAIPFYLLIQNFSPRAYLTILVIAIIVGMWLCERTEQDIGVHDHSGIVFDEFVGYGLVMFAAPKGWLWVMLGFILFRLFDIWKPQPIRWLDENTHSGIGTVVDDLLAAIPALIIMQLIKWFCGY